MVVSPPGGQRLISGRPVAKVAAGRIEFQSGPSEVADLVGRVIPALEAKLPVRTRFVKREEG